MKFCILYFSYADTSSKASATRDALHSKSSKLRVCLSAGPWGMRLQDSPWRRQRKHCTTSTLQLQSMFHWLHSHVEMGQRIKRLVNWFVSNFNSSVMIKLNIYTTSKCWWRSKKSTQLMGEKGGGKNNCQKLTDLLYMWVLIQSLEVKKFIYYNLDVVKGIILSIWLIYM